MKAHDDVHHIEEVLKGNTAAFASLVNRYQDMVYTITVRILQNREEAEEAAQDAFVKAFGKLSTFRRDSRFSTWLYRIAFNEAVSRTRLKRLPEVELIEEITETCPDQEVEEEVMGLDRFEQKRVISMAMQKLDEQDQLLISLYYFEDLPVSDLCEITGLSDSNVKVKLHRLRKKIYKELDEILSRKMYSL